MQERSHSGTDAPERTGREPSHRGSSGRPRAITVRDRRFGRTEGAQRWWLNNDPIGTAWFNALSATFPRGETLFIEAVKAFRDGTPPELEREIRAFVRQEVNHTREHIAFNRAVLAAGYDMSGIDRRVADLIAKVKEREPIAWLGVTIALEHFTAMFAHELLTKPDHFIGADAAQAELWRWHAVEEIEHKGVAYDTWLHATGRWGGWKRWRLRSLLMLITTRHFIADRFRDSLDLLAQDGITGWTARRRVIWYLIARPAILRRVLPAWLSYFRPGFHPWQLDDRDLVDQHDGASPASAIRTA